ncbi:MAG: hypothetical protein LW715_10825 [Rhodobacter sp.]|nr:hypothetical protein [Rhodobacter sp.]
MAGSVVAGAGSSAGGATASAQGRSTAAGAGSAAGGATAAGSSSAVTGVPAWAARPAQRSQAGGRTLPAASGGRRGVATGRAVATLIEA